MRRVGRAAALLLILAGSACTVRSRVRLAVEEAVPPSGRSVCVLFCDGLSSEAFQRLLSAGVLPNIRRELVDRGLSFDTAVASVPSETYPNLAAMLTGLLPGHHGIPANIWLDRSLRRREAHTNIFRTYSTADFLTPEARTLYERLPADTVAITTPIARGATVRVKNIVALIASYARNDWAFLDRKTVNDVGDAYSGAASTGRLPSLVWGHILGPDEVAHLDGPESPQFRDTLASFDRAFGRLIRRLIRRKVYDRILFVLLGDHGNRSYGTFVDVDELVNRALFNHPTEADCASGNCVLVSLRGKHPKSYDVGDALIAVGAYRGAMIWLPGTRPPEGIPTAFRTRRKRPRPGGTPRPPSFRMPAASEFAAWLARAPEIQLVVTRGSEPEHIEVYGPRGRAEILREEPEQGEARYAYTVIEGEDPLGYAARPDLLPLLGTFHSAAEWLAATASTEYPDLVVQLPEFFDSPRAPDVYLSPREGFGFRGGWAAGHGGLSREETVVPLIFAGPGVRHGGRLVARTVDLAPTLLSYLGVPFDAEEMDGQDLQIAPPPRPADPLFRMMTP